MSEYELCDLINGITSNMLAEQAVFVTLVTAYLIVAYSVGKSLTTYQIFFVNILFALIVLAGTQGQWAMFGEIFDYQDRMNEVININKPLAFSETSQYIRLVWISIRVMLTIGALVFMWQVRHPKPE